MSLVPQLSSVAPAAERLSPSVKGPQPGHPNPRVQVRSRPIITVAAPKGGVGKSTLAYELAASLGLVLIDLDFDNGGVTKMWGDSVRRRDRSLLLEGLATDRADLPTPRFLNKAGRPGLVPGDHRLALLREVHPELMSQRLQQWTEVWGRGVVIDTHPGTAVLSDAAMAVSHLVIVPLVLGARELDALHDFLQERGRDFPLMLVPTMFRKVLGDIALLKSIIGELDTFGIPFTPPISYFPWLHRRQTIRQALTLTVGAGRDVQEAADQFRTLATAVTTRLKYGRYPA